MKQMKVLKVLAGLAVLVAVALPAQAQQYRTATPYTTLVAASGTSNLTAAAVYGVTKYEDVAIHVKTYLAGSGTDNTVVTYQRSADGTTYETTGFLVITIVNTGTTPVNTITNINVGAAGFIRLSTIVNGDTGDILTVTNTVAFKPQRFGR
jgi:hypothetical protein